MKQLDKKLAASNGGRVVKFIENFCVHGEGDFYGAPFKLDLWQKQLIYNLYELNEDRSRKYREALVGVPKGNGKSQLAAAIGLYELLGAGTVSPLVTVAAASFEQADLVFGTMRTMCEQSPYLKNVTEVFNNSIGVKKGPGRVFVLLLKLGQLTVVETQLLLLMRFTNGPLQTCSVFIMFCLITRLKERTA